MMTKNQRKQASFVILSVVLTLMLITIGSLVCLLVTKSDKIMKVVENQPVVRQVQTKPINLLFKCEKMTYAYQFNSETGELTSSYQF